MVRVQSTISGSSDAESCQRHPEVSRRDDAEFGAQPARRTTVVGDRDHGGDVERQASDGLERGEQSVPAAERDDGRPLGCLPRAMCRFTHSRPRSPVHDADRDVVLGTQTPRESFGHGYASVLTAGAPDRNCHVALSFSSISGDRQIHQMSVGVEIVFRALTGQHVVANVGVLTGVRAKFRDPVGIGQETNVTDEISVHGQAVLESERLDRHLHRSVGIVSERRFDLLTQLMRLQCRRVDDQIGGRLHHGQLPTLGCDPFGQRAVDAVVLQRMTAAHLFEPSDQHVVRRFEVQHPSVDRFRLEFGEHPPEIAGEESTPHVESRRRDDRPADRRSSSDRPFGK